MAQFAGPSTNLLTRLRRGDKGQSDVDRTAKRHDIEFSLAETPEDVRKADEKMLENLRKIRERGSDYSINIENAYNAIRNKVFAEKIGLLKKGSFSGMKGKELSSEDRKLLLDNLKNLEQQGFGSNRKIHKGRALWSNEIEFLMKNDKNFKGVYSKDQLKKLKINKTKPFSLVYNLEDSNKGGSHWCCINFEPSQNFVEHFDSFGVFPCNEAVELMKKVNKKIIYNDMQLQKFNSVLCGFYCIEYLKERKKKTPNLILNDFTQEPSVFNELKVLHDSF